MVIKLYYFKVLQTLRGHEHVIESISFGKKPLIQSLLEGNKATTSGSSATTADSQVKKYFYYHYYYYFFFIFLVLLHLTC